MPNNHVALILVEGETEEVFYKRIAQDMLKGIPKHIRNMKGNYNINSKIIDRSRQFSDAHPKKTFDVYICVDRERIGMPVYNETLVNERINPLRGFETKIDIIAELMIESLFFADIDNIYSHLRIRKNLRFPKKFKNFRQFTHRELTQLFESNGKQYYKGHKCESLIKDLDIKLIISKASELELLVNNIKIRHNKFNQ